MSSIMLAADTTGVEQRYSQVQAREPLRTKESASLLRRLEGLAAGSLFLATRLPIYVGALFLAALFTLGGAVLYLVQAVGLRLMRLGGTAAATALALVCVAGPQRARADMVSDGSLLNQTTLVFSQQTNLYSFDAPGAGTLSVNLKDWQFPVPLQQLSASILSQDQVLGSFDSSKDSDWSFEVPISSAGVFDAFVAAQSGSFSGLQFGAYSMSISFQPSASPVPLPPALDLLLGGMGLLGAVTLVERLSRRRNGDVISIA